MVLEDGTVAFDYMRRLTICIFGDELLWEAPILKLEGGGPMKIAFSIVFDYGKLHAIWVHWKAFVWALRLSFV